MSKQIILSMIQREQALISLIKDACELSFDAKLTVSFILQLKGIQKRIRDEKIYNAKIRNLKGRLC